MKENIQNYAAFMAPIFLIAMAFAIPTSITLTTILALFVLTCVLFSGNWKEKWTVLLKNPVSLSFLALSSVFLLGLLYSQGNAHQIIYDLKKHHAYFFAPFFILALPSDKIRKYILNFFLAGMLLTVALSYLKWLHIYDANTNLPGVGVFYTRIVQNIFLSFAAGICAYRFFYYEKWNWLYAVLFFLIGANVMLVSDGRTGYVSFAIVIAYVALFRFGWKMLLFSLACIAMLFTAAYFVSPQFKERINLVHQEGKLYQQQGKNDTSMGVRLSELQYTPTLIKKKWLIGYGTGGLFNAVASLPLEERSPWFSYMETGYLNIILEFGVLGLLVFLGVFAIQIFYSFKLPREYRFIMQLFFCIYLISALANPVFVSFGELNLYVFLSAVMFSALPLLNQKSIKE